MPNTYRIDIDASAINSAMNQVAKLDQHFDALIASVTALNSTVKTNFDAVAASTKEVASSTKSMLTEMEKGYKGLSEGIGKGYNKAMGKLISETDITVKHLVGQYDTMARNTAKAMGKQNSVVISMTQKMNKESVKNLKEMQNGFREEVGGIKAVFYELMREAKANTDGTVAAFKAMSTGVRDDLKDVNTALRSTIATVLRFKRSMRDNMGDAVKQLKSTTSSMSTEMAFLRGDIQKLSRQFDKSTKEMVKANQQMADEVTQALIRIKQEQQYLNKHSKQNITSLSDLWREFRRGVATVMAAYYAIRMISAAFRTFIDHTLLMEGVNKRFASMSGGLTEGVKVLGDLKKAASGMGLEYKSLFEEYSKFYAATKNNPILAKESMAIFEGVTAAGAALGLTNEKMKLVTYALMQMASKGRVLSEEMTRQLGDNLPGALQIASRSLGLTTAEFVKMMQEGNILAEDFLPAFGREMKRQFGDVAVSNIHSTQGALNELNNALFELKEFLMTDMGGSAFFRSMLSGFASIIGSITTALSYYKGVVGEGSKDWKMVEVAGADTALRNMGLGGFTTEDIKKLNQLPKLSLEDVTAEQLLGTLDDKELQKRAEKAVGAYVKAFQAQKFADQLSLPRPTFLDKDVQQSIDVGRFILSRMKSAEGQAEAVKKKLKEVNAELIKERRTYADIQKGVQEGSSLSTPSGFFFAPASAFENNPIVQEQKQEVQALEAQQRLLIARLKQLERPGGYKDFVGLRPFEKEMAFAGGLGALKEGIPEIEDMTIKGLTYGREGALTAQDKTFKEQNEKKKAETKLLEALIKEAKRVKQYEEKELKIEEQIEVIRKARAYIAEASEKDLQRALASSTSGTQESLIGTLLKVGSREEALTELDKIKASAEAALVAERKKIEVAEAKQRARFAVKLSGLGGFDAESPAFQRKFEEYKGKTPEEKAEMEQQIADAVSLIQFNRTELEKAMEALASAENTLLPQLQEGLIDKARYDQIMTNMQKRVKDAEQAIEDKRKLAEVTAANVRKRQVQLYRTLKDFIGEDLGAEEFITRFERLTPEQQKQLEMLATNASRNVKKGLPEITKREQTIRSIQGLQQEMSGMGYGFTWKSELFDSAIKRNEDQIEALRIQHDESLQKMIKMVDNWESRFIDAFMNVVKTGKFAFADLIESMLMDMARVEAQKALSPIFETVMGAFLPGVMKDRATEKRVKAAGGVTGGGTGTDTASRAEAFLDYTPTFHSGGIVGHDELQATLKKGEGVFTKKQMDAIGGALDRGAVSINIVNNSPVEVSASVNKSDPRQIDILIRDKVRGMFNSGDMDGVMNNNFGMRRSPR